MTEPVLTPSGKPARPRSGLWFWVFLLAAVQGIAALMALASLPADADNSRWLGYSTGRLALMGLLLGVSAGSGLLAWFSRRFPKRFEPSRWGWLRKALFIVLPLAVAGSVITPVALLSLYRASGEFRYYAFYQRLLPVFAWLALTCLEIFVVLAATGRFTWKSACAQKPVFRAALVTWAIFGLAALFVASTGIGITRDVVGWGLPAVALLEWQIGLAWAAGTVLLVFLAFRQSKSPGVLGSRFDMAIAAAIWLLAAGVWLSLPAQPGFFATQGRAPNFETYPFSDGAYYGSFAQSILIGNGFKGAEIPPRPFYITLLAGFHALAGQKYEHVIALQTLFLAFFPVILYFLGKELNSRHAGLAIALLAILREGTAIIAAPFTDNASTSRLFFADLPTALVISLWILLVVRWLKAPARSSNSLLPMVVGSGIGLAMLFRTQSMFMVPAVLLLALFVYRFRWWAWLRAATLLILGLALITAPWLLRNYANTGQFGFDDPKSQTGSMAARYSLSGDERSFVIRPGENEQAYSARVTKGIFDFLSTHPDVVAGFIGAHFLNAEIDNTLILPVRDALRQPGDLLVPSYAFWETWKGAFSPGQGLLFALNLALIALGVGASYARLGWVGLVPLAGNLSYNFSMSLARNSGGRYLLAVDWVAYVYAAIGLIELSLTVMALLGVRWEWLNPLLAHRDAGLREQALPRLRQSIPRVVWFGLAALAFGSILPLVEWIVPQRYPVQTRAGLVTEVLEDARLAKSGVDRAALERFMAQPGVAVIKGRALYPRFYEAGNGEPSTAKTAYEPLPYARTVFLAVSNSFNGLLVLRASQAPEYFPNASDVIAVGCPGGVYVDVALLLVKGSPGGVYTAGGELPARCPLP